MSDLIYNDYLAGQERADDHQYGSPTAWTHIEEIRTSLWHRVQHYKRNGIGMIKAYYHTPLIAGMTMEEANEEKERIAADRYNAYFSNHQ